MFRQIMLNFIKDYESHVVLWDLNDCFYSNKTKRHEAYADLAAKYNVSIESVNKQINYLRRKFFEEQRKSFFSFNTGNVYVSKWFAYEALLFLSGITSPTTTNSSGENTELNCNENGTESIGAKENITVAIEDFSIPSTSKNQLQGNQSNASQSQLLGSQHDASQLQLQGNLCDASQSQLQGNLCDASQSQLQGNQCDAYQSQLQGNLCDASQLQLQGNQCNASQSQLLGSQHDASQLQLQGNLCDASQLQLQGNLCDASQSQLQGNQCDASQSQLQGNLCDASQLQLQGNQCNASQSQLQGNLCDASQSVKNTRGSKRKREQDDEDDDEGCSSLKLTEKAFAEKDHSDLYGHYIALLIGELNKRNQEAAIIQVLNLVYNFEKQEMPDD